MNNKPHPLNPPLLPGEGKENWRGAKPLSYSPRFGGKGRSFERGGEAPLEHPDGELARDNNPYQASVYASSPKKVMRLRVEERRSLSYNNNNSLLPLEREGGEGKGLNSTEEE